MEGELWDEVYRWVREIGKSYPSPRMQYSHAYIALVWLWAVLHDRPMSWACQVANWP